MNEYIPKVGEEFHCHDWGAAPGCVCKGYHGDFVLYRGETLAGKITFGISLKSDCFPIKTPEQRESEKNIDSIAALIADSGHLGVEILSSNKLAKTLHEGGYHNQPKVKGLSFKEFETALEINNHKYGAFESLRDDNYIIEKKKQDND